MIGKRYFARNADGSIKTKQPCQTKGCNHPNWHVCLVGKPPVDPELIVKHSRRSISQGHSEEHKQAIADAQRLRWARLRGALV